MPTTVDDDGDEVYWTPTVVTPDPDNWEPIFANFESILHYYSVPTETREATNTRWATEMEHIDTFFRRYLREHGLSVAIMSDPKAAYVALGIFEGATGAMLNAIESLFSKGGPVRKTDLDNILSATRQALAVRIAWMALTHPDAFDVVGVDPSELLREPFGDTVSLSDMPPDPL